MLKIVFFDWGGVLCDSMLGRIENEVGLKWTPARRRVISKLNTGRLPLTSAIRQIARGTDWQSRWDDLMRITLQHLMTHRQPLTWTIAGMLRGLGLRTGILSNQSIEWACQIAALYNLITTFQPAIFSGIESVKSGRALLKPGPAIYRYALKAARVKPGEAALIDDQEENCRGAREVGMHAIRYENPAKLHHDLEVFLTAQKVPLQRGRARKTPRPPPCDCHP